MNAIFACARTGVLVGLYVSAALAVIAVSAPEPRADDGPSKGRLLAASGDAALVDGLKGALPRLVNDLAQDAAVSAFDQTFAEALLAAAGEDRELFQRGTRGGSGLEEKGKPSGADRWEGGERGGAQRWGRGTGGS